MEAVVDDLYRDLRGAPRTGRPHVALGMVMAADGAVTVAGRTRQLGGEADRVAFRRLRERADTILVGAGTARQEDYGPPRLASEARDRRAARGQAPQPELAVVTASCRLDPDARLFGAGHAPLVLTTDDAPVGGLADVATILRAGTGRVDWTRALGTLADRGTGWLLVEGGPTVNGQLAAADLVDEVYVTVAPVLAGGRAGLLGDELADAPRPLQLAELHRFGDEVLFRYRVRHHGSPGPGQ